MKLRAAPLLLLLMTAVSAAALSACTSSGYRTIVVQPLAPISSYAAGADTSLATGTFDLSICHDVQTVLQAASGGRKLSEAMQTRLRFIYVDAHQAPPFGADPQLAADLPLSTQTVQQLATAEADCKRVGFVFAIPALPAPAQHAKPTAAVVWALLVATVLGPLVVGAGLWTLLSGTARSKENPERDAYVGRMSVLVARLLAIAIAASISGPRLADLTGWRRPATVGMVAVVATVLMGIYPLVVHRRLVAMGRPSASGRYVYLLALTLTAIVPWLIVGLAGAALAGTGPRVGEVIFAALLSVALWWFAVPWLTIRLLTTPCPPDIEALVLELCNRHGQSIRAARLIALKGRPLAWAAVYGTQRRQRYIVVSEDLVQNLSRPLFAATMAHEIGHLAANKHPWRTLAIGIGGIAYCYAFMAFGSGDLPLVVPVVIAVQTIFAQTKQRREIAADAFAASSSGPAVIAAALTRIAEVNGLRTDAGAVTYLGATHPHLAARIGAIVAAATPAQGSAATPAQGSAATPAQGSAATPAQG